MCLVSPTGLIPRKLALTLSVVEGALRAGPEANPPYNMLRGLVFQVVLTVSSVAFVAALRGKQARREMDEQKLEESKQTMAMIDTSK